MAGRVGTCSRHRWAIGAGYQGQVLFSTRCSFNTHTLPEPTILLILDSLDKVLADNLIMANQNMNSEPVLVYSKELTSVVVLGFPVLLLTTDRSLASSH